MTLTTLTTPNDSGYPDDSDYPDALMPLMTPNTLTLPPPHLPGSFAASASLVPGTVALEMRYGQGPSYDLYACQPPVTAPASPHTTFKCVTSPGVHTTVTTAQCACCCHR